MIKRYDLPVSIISMKEKTIIYLLITGIIAIICGGGFVWYASQFEPEFSTIKITYQKLQVLGEETKQVGIQEQVDQESIEEETIIEEPQPTTQSVIKTGMSSSEINNLYQTYYKRQASQDEINWWTGKEKNELETSLINNPISSSTPILNPILDTPEVDEKIIEDEQIESFEYKKERCTYEADKKFQEDYEKMYKILLDAVIYKYKEKGQEIIFNSWEVNYKNCYDNRLQFEPSPDISPEQHRELRNRQIESCEDHADTLERQGNEVISTLKDNLINDLTKLRDKYYIDCIAN